MTLHSHTWGDPGGPRVLLIHGVQSSGATWWRIAEGLAHAGAHVTAPDLPGHGASPRGTSYRFADLVADLGDGWDLVAGHSLGGTLAAYALAEDRDFARRAVLLDPVFELPEDDFEAIVAGQLAELATSGAALQAAYPHWHPEDCRRKAQAAAACDPYAAEAVLRDNRPWDHAHLLDGLDAEVIGADPAHGAMFTPRAPATRYRMLEGTGHSLHRDAPGPVTAVLKGALCP
jgi:pimeloyl-ACP methyl ester carboxylesterase